MSPLKRNIWQRLFGFDSRAYRKDPVKWFQSSVSGSNLTLWNPGDAISSDADIRFLFGISTWSGYDNKLMVDADRFMARNPGCSIRVDAFCMDQISETSELEQYYPVNAKLINTLINTPVVGMWAHGIFEKVIDGCAAEAFVRQTFLQLPQDDSRLK